MKTKSKVKQVQFKAKILRADGSVEDLGVISDSSIWFRLWGHRKAKKRIQASNMR